jgi:hypothetical protein
VAEWSRGCTGCGSANPNILIFYFGYVTQLHDGNQWRNLQRPRHGPAPRLCTGRPVSCGNQTNKQEHANRPARSGFEVTRNRLIQQVLPHWSTATPVFLRVIARAAETASRAAKLVEPGSRRSYPPTSRVLQSGWALRQSYTSTRVTQGNSAFKFRANAGLRGPPKGSTVVIRRPASGEPSRVRQELNCGGERREIVVPNWLCARVKYYEVGVAAGRCQ